MPILPDEQLERLRRKSWLGPNGAELLSQELYAMFVSEGPITITSPVTFEQTGNAPAVTITPNPRPTPDTLPALDAPGGGGSGGGGVNPADIDFGSFGTPDQNGLTTTTPIVLYGVVQSKVGGQVYLVRCWLGDPSTSPILGNFNCTHGQIDPDDTIPSGTHCLVWCSIGTGFVVSAMRIVTPVFSV